MPTPSPLHPVITLLTDFGTQDAFVGIMKGVILSLCPAARLVDLTHEIAPGEIRGGALALAWAVPYFAPGTVHLAVVDPGVGGPRRPLVLSGERGILVGPDNGLLWPAARQLGASTAWEIDLTNWDRPVSATFHGRDVFAPAAARLARGERPDGFCRPAEEVVRLEWPRPVRTGSEVHGEFIALDRFGNAITNLSPADLRQPKEGAAVFVMGEHEVRGPSASYGSVPPGEPVVVLGSAGLYEVAVNQGSAAVALGLDIGSGVVARRRGGKAPRGG